MRRKRTEALSRGSPPQALSSHAGSPAAEGSPASTPAQEQPETRQARKQPAARGLGRIFQRGPVYWIAYCHRGKEYRESTHTTGTKGETLAGLRGYVLDSSSPHG